MRCENAIVPLYLYLYISYKHMIKSSLFQEGHVSYQSAIVIWVGMGRSVGLAAKANKCLITDQGAKSVEIDSAG